jgi:hypothetical protein
MQIHCRVCKSEIPAANITLENLVAKCAVCNAVFSIRESVQNRESLPIRQPKGVSVNRQGARLLITQRFHSFAFWISVLVGIPTLIAFYVFGRAWVSTFPIVGLLFVGVGTLIIYNLLTGFLNTTLIEVTHKTISVTQSPVPTFNNRQVMAGDLVQIYCIEQHNFRSLPIHHLFMLARDGSKQLLLPNIGLQQALFIEHEVEAFLGIPDQHVPGAVE